MILELGNFEESTDDILNYFFNKKKWNIIYKLLLNKLNKNVKSNENNNIVWKSPEGCCWIKKNQLNLWE